MTQAFYAVSEKLYQQANPQGPQGGPQQGGTGDGSQQGNVYDAEYREVDGDQK